MLILLVKRISALGMRLAIEQSSLEARGPHNGADVQHAALEAIVRCIQALTGMHSLSRANLTPADTINVQRARLASQVLCVSLSVGMKKWTKSTANMLQSWRGDVSAAARVCLPKYTASVAIPELGAYAGESFWTQQGIKDANLAASSVLTTLAGKLPALSDALLAAETALQAGLADFRRLSGPLNKLLLSLASQILQLKHADALAQLPHLLFIPLLFSRRASASHQCCTCREPFEML